MMGFGAMELLVLILLAGGQTNSDLVAFIPPQHYFQSRQIEVSIDKMMELASSDPKDAKKQIMQLTALRYLEEESASLKKGAHYADHRQTLEQIAAGKKAGDPQGFAREYAQSVLAKLDGTKLPAHKTPLLREQAAWFPADTTLLASFDLRRSPATMATKDPLLDLIKSIPDQVKNQIYDGIEKFGNLRLETVSLALSGRDKDGNEQKIMMRFTGKANPVWLTEAASSLSGGQLEVTQEKDAQEQPIRKMQVAGRAPLIATIGDSDLVIVGYKKDQAKHEEILQEVLAVRAKKRPDAAAGPLKDQLAKVPAKAIALLVGELPAEAKREFRFVFDPTPEKVFGYIDRAPQGLDVNIEATMANADGAGKLVTKIGTLRKEGIQAIQQAQQLPQPPGLPMVPFPALINVLESLQVQNQAEKVQVRVLIPDSLVQQLSTMSMMFGGRVEARPIAPLPPPAQK